MYKISCRTTNSNEGNFHSHYWLESYVSTLVIKKYPPTNNTVYTITLHFSVYTTCFAILPPTDVCSLLMCVVISVVSLRCAVLTEWSSQSRHMVSSKSHLRNQPWIEKERERERGEKYNDMYTTHLSRQQDRETCEQSKWRCKWEIHCLWIVAYYVTIALK